MKNPLIFILACSIAGAFSGVALSKMRKTDPAAIEYNDGTVTLDLAQWQCRQAETVLTLVDEKLTPVGQCTRYERIISED